MRIVSLLPSATEILVLVGGARDLVGRSHECDFPAEITHLPKLTGQFIEFESSAQMDAAVRERLAQGKGLYSIDTAALAELKPDLILTQSLCEVCSVDLCIVEAAAAKLDPPPAVISLSPQHLDEVLSHVLSVGVAVGREKEAEAAHAALTDRIRRVEERAAARLAQGAPRPTFAMLEWVDPIFIGGHWTPEIINMAGGSHPLNPSRGRGDGAGKSTVIEAERVVASKPDFVLIAPCGLGIPATRAELAKLSADKGAWLQALKDSGSKLYLVDGNHYFNRPGPRLVDALEFVSALVEGKDSGKEGAQTAPEGFLYEPL